MPAAVTGGERRAVCRAPQGAVAWTPHIGWTDDGIEIRERQEAGEPVCVVTRGEVVVDPEKEAVLVATTLTGLSQGVLAGHFSLDQATGIIDYTLDRLFTNA